MKKLYLLLLLCLGGLAVHAQSGRFTLKGVVADTAGVGLPEATVMLLTPKDSALVNFGRTDKNGAFEFKNIKRIPYLLKVSYVGYLPYQHEVRPNDGDVTDMGKLPMKFLNQDLYEVVIKTARAPLSIKGDTVEYDPRAFKVPPGSTVEDLLRKLPGMQVEQDGSLKAQGESVKRVTVDGKRFFGDDVKAATKNLPAEAISKVQVFNDKTEQSRITGVDDGKREKTLNLQLKDSHKKGGFGKATLGFGTDKRVEGKVNYNRFNSKNQFSVIGLGTNTNSGGMSWDDYQDFKGSQSFNWGDDGDFGFGGGRYISFGGDNDQESLTIQAGRGSQNRGFNKNWAGGLNYNFDEKKTKFNTSYYYNQATQDLDATSKRTTFLNNLSYSTLDTNSRLNFNENHRGGLRFEKELDSLNSIIVLSNVRFGSGRTDYAAHQEYLLGDQANQRRSTMSDFDNTSDFHSFAIGNTAIYRHKFKKKGRNFAASFAYNVNNSDGHNTQKSINRFYKTSTTSPDSIVNINQINDTKSLRSQIKSSLLYIEPIKKIFFLETFYNFSLKSDEVDRNVFDVKEYSQIINEKLTRYYNNRTTFNRGGTSLRYSKKGINISGGIAVQQISMDGDFSINETDPNKTNVQRSFVNWIPSFSTSIDLKNNRWLYGNYNVSVQEPNIGDLQPIVDNSNPLYIRVGNPNLVPTLTHQGNVGFNYFNPGSFIQMFFGAYYSQYQNQVIYNQTVASNLVTTTMATNISGGRSFNLYGDYGFPIVKTKLTMNFNLSYYQGNNPIYINEILNKTTNRNYNFGFRMNLTPSDKFTLYTNASWSPSRTKYSINTAQNQKMFNSFYGAEMNIKLPKDIYFNSRFNYNIYVNDRFGFNQSLPILNLSVYKTMLKSKKGEIRLSAFDMFNKNRGISQQAYGNVVSQEQVRTLARYFMLSFTYNMRGVAHSVNRKGFGW